MCEFGLNRRTLATGARRAFDGSSPGRMHLHTHVPEALVAWDETLASVAWDEQFGETLPACTADTEADYTEACQIERVEHTAVDYTAVDYTAVDYTAVDYTAVDYTAVDCTAVDCTHRNKQVGQSSWQSAKKQALEREQAMVPSVQ